MQVDQCFGKVFFKSFLKSRNNLGKGVLEHYENVKNVYEKRRNFQNLMVAKGLGNIWLNWKLKWNERKKIWKV